MDVDDGVQGPRRSHPAELLDELFREDGQTLSALEERFVDDSLRRDEAPKQLEDAGLVVTRRRGREKLHFLNPVPIRLVHDRWVSKYAEPWAAALSDLKTQNGESDGEGFRDLHPHHSRAPLGGDHRQRDPEQVPVRRRQDVGLDAGSRYEMRRPRPTALLGEGENLEVDPPRRLVQSMVALWSDDVKSEGTSRVTWEIEPVGDSCRLTVTHDQLREGANDQLYGGWPMILSGLKTWLETGELLTTPGSLMYS